MAGPRPLRSDVSELADREDFPVSELPIEPVQRRDGRRPAGRSTSPSQNNLIKRIRRIEPPYERIRVSNTRAHTQARKTRFVTLARQGNKSIPTALPAPRPDARRMAPRRRASTKNRISGFAAAASEQRKERRRRGKATEATAGLPAAPKRHPCDESY